MMTELQFGPRLLGSKALHTGQPATPSLGREKQNKTQTTHFRFLRAVRPPHGKK